MKKFFIGFVIIVGLFFYMRNDKKTQTETQKELQDELIDNSVKKAKSKEEPLPLLTQPTQISQELPKAKKDYLTPSEFSLIRDQVGLHLKHSDYSLENVEMGENSIALIFDKNMKEEKSLDYFLNDLNIDLTTLKEDYRAYFDKKSQSIKIQLLDDYLTEISEKIQEKSKDLTSVELFYTTPLQTKALGCLIGHEYEEASNFHAKNNCISHSIHSARAHELISSFYKKNTPPQNFSKIQSDVLPLWTEFYGKQEDLVQGNQHLFFCHPNDRTIWFDAGCNFRVTIKSKSL